VVVAPVRGVRGGTRMNTQDVVRWFILRERLSHRWIGIAAFKARVKLEESPFRLWNGAEAAREMCCNQSHFAKHRDARYSAWCGSSQWPIQRERSARKRVYKAWRSGIFPPSAKRIRVGFSRRMGLPSSVAILQLTDK